jgi:hypothetical protein
MTDTTANLGLPVIAAAQAQKHVTHNEALRVLDTLVQLAVLDRDLGAPPASPGAGERWIVGPSPSGAWAGRADQVAAWQDGAWQFSAPQPGWVAYVADETRIVAWDGTAWGAFAAELADGSVGTDALADAAVTNDKLALEYDDWTPVLTFATPGDLSVAYSNQTGSYVRIGTFVIAEFTLTTSTFTHSTASGSARITGLPLTSAAAYRGAMSWRGITKVNYTQVTPAISGSNIIFTASGSGQATASVAAADMPTGGTVDLRGFVIFRV